ncbi:MAG: autotransporter-associated beta strand repeat-containing protein [Verrucomicrobia bacterium]|nr:autotransporter-associated beta strand repeat-containing protein [Verrucomicrobiota bacterium]
MKPKQRPLLCSVLPAHIALGFGLAVVGIPSQSASADSIAWNGTTGSNWNDTASWNPTQIPTSADDLTILGPVNIAGALTINVNTAAAANTINFTNTSTTALTNTTSGANQTLTLQGGLTVGTGAVTIGSATANQNVNIALGASQTWDIGSGGLTVVNVISGSGFQLTKNGTGTLTLSGANTYSGGTVLNAGTLTLGNATALGSGALTLKGGTLLSTTNSQTITNNIVLDGSATIQRGSGAFNFALNGGISGSGNLTLNTGGNNNSLYLGGTNTMTSGTITYQTSTSGIVRFSTVNAGNENVAWVFNRLANFDLGAGTRTIKFGSLSGTGGLAGNTAGTLTIEAGNLGLNDSYSGQITNGANSVIGLTKVGSGTLTLTAGNNNYTGGTTIQNGTLNATYATGTSNTTFSAVPAGQAISVANGAALVLTLNGSRDAFFNQTITGSGSTTVTTSGSAGRFLNITSTLNNRFSSDGDLTVDSVGTGTIGLNLFGSNQTIGALKGGNLAIITTNGNGTTSTLTIGNNNNSGTYSGQLTQGGGAYILAITKVGTGTQTLTGSSNNYTGMTSINGGTLNAGHANAFGTTGNITFGGGALQYSAASAGTNFASRIKNSSGAIAIDTNGQSVSLGGLDSSNTGGLTKSGAGTLTLTGANTYTGDTTVAGGTLALGGTGSIASSAKIKVSTTLSVTGLTGDFTLEAAQTLVGSGTLLATGRTVTANGTLAPGNSPGTFTQDGGTLRLGLNGDLNWQVYDAAGVAGSGYDTVSLTSGSILDLSLLSASNRYNINLWSLSGLGPDVNGDAIHFDNTQSYGWTLFSTDSAITGFDPSYFNIQTGAANGTAGFSNALGAGSFRVALGDGNTDLVLQFIPEPDAALLGALGMLMLLRRRRP